MSNLSLKQQLSDMKNNEYPFVRRDTGDVRAKVLEEFEDEFGRPCVLAEVLAPKKEANIRVITKEYFDNNFWEGVD